VRRPGRGSTSASKGADGESQILVIDPATLEYHPQARPKLGALAAAESVTDTGERIAKLFKGTDRSATSCGRRWGRRSTTRRR
jgi:hypothetical protein